MLAKVKTSLLTPEHARLLRLEPFPEGHDLPIYPRLAGFKIPYFTLDGKVDPDFYRFRFTQTKPSHGWASAAEAPEKPRRYAQPADTQCGVYLPPLLEESWAVIANDPTIPLIITEGELKAACGCALDKPTIGLGGVFNWRSAKQHQELLPILEAFKWDKRPVNICFDSDVTTNVMVRIAASRLAAELAQRGALVAWTALPARKSGDKQGLDDLAYDEGEAELVKVLNTAEPLGPGIMLHELNAKVAVVKSTGEVVDLATGTAHSATMFTDVIYKPWHYTEWKKSADGEAKGTPKFAAKEWLAWPLRNEVTKVVYEPGDSALITAEGAYNSWAHNGWGCEPSSSGSIAPWERLIARMFKGSPEDHITWVKRWFACPVQHPGTNLHSALLIWGPGQGTGKTLLGETMREIYGANYGTVNNALLASQFNEWAVDKQFIVGDEISIGDKRHMAEGIKDLVTGDTIRLNSKNRKTYVVRNCINYYFTSNHQDAMYLEGADRRIFVHRVDSDPLTPEESSAYTKWLRKDGGAERLHYYLRHELDLGTFDPTARPPWTASKSDMVAGQRGDTEDWCIQLAQDPSSILRPDANPYDLFRTIDLLAVYDPDKREKTKSVGLSRALNAAGIFQVANGNNSGVVDGMRSRFWAVRNAGLYKTMGPAQAAKAYVSERTDDAKKRKAAQLFKEGAVGGGDPPKKFEAPSAKPRRTN